ncbi:MAG: UDP-galactopyranose mutase [Sphaerochaetaceae bacterium]|jgi:UDP-galactopyranose mutase|nr:UDP-galactopyranose mutase [Sphaerochaetaceae bacterium]
MNKQHYDFLIVGSGLYGSVFAHEAMKRGKSVLVVEKRPHKGGNLYCLERDGIQIHYYGAHIFHTKSKAIWDYCNELSEFAFYINSPVANFNGRLYNLPFNMNTFYQLWGTVTPAQAMEKIESQRLKLNRDPENLEEQGLCLAGKDIFDTLIKGYTEKQWGRPCSALPPSILKRVPFRFRYDNNYFNDPYQGIPKGGYNTLIDALLDGAEVLLNTDFNENRQLADLADKVLYTGTIDSYFDFSEGELNYRSERFELVRYDEENHQGVAVMNYTDTKTPYTRAIEHKHFEPKDGINATWVSYEYPMEYSKSAEPYYPVNDQRNTRLYETYKAMAQKEEKLLLGGRLAQYSYFDMDKTVEAALKLVQQVMPEA